MGGPQREHLTMTSPTPRPWLAWLYLALAVAGGILPWLANLDYMRQYDIVKRMERMGKSVGMLTGQAEPTIIQPPMYKKRFNAAMERYFMSIPDKWLLSGL